ncbi:hypothetical protein [Bradyrhizobium sp. USDA 3364]
MRGRFPTDTFEPVGKGELGADVIQHRSTDRLASPPASSLCRRTKSWSDGWLAKLRDQRADQSLAERDRLRQRG